MEENDAETEAWESLKNLNLDEPIDRSWFDRPPGQRDQLFTFQFLFLILWSFSCPFQLKSPIFYAQCQGNFDFWSKFDHDLSMFLYDAYDMKFMQSEGIFIKNSLSNH